MDFSADFMDFSAERSGDGAPPGRLKKFLRSGIEMLHTCNYIGCTDAGDGEAPLRMRFRTVRRRGIFLPISLHVCN
jgi:hypothetical protein